MDQPPQQPNMSAEEIKRRLANLEESDKEAQENLKRAMEALSEFEGENVKDKKGWWAKRKERKERESIDEEKERGEIEAEIENMPERERNKVTTFLRTVGFRVEKGKHNFFAKTFEKITASGIV